MARSHGQHEACVAFYKQVYEEWEDGERQIQIFRAETLREKQILIRISKKKKCGTESILNEVVVSRALRTSLSMVFRQHDIFTHLDTACM